MCNQAHAFAVPNSQVNGLLQTSLDAVLDDDAIDDRFNVVRRCCRKLGRVGRIHDLAVDPRTHQTVTGDLLQCFAIAAFSTANNRGEDHHLATLFQCHDLIDDRLRGLTLNGQAAVGTVSLASSCVEQSQVVVDFCRSGQRAAKRDGSNALVHTHRWR